VNRRSLCVAAVQMMSENGQRQANLLRASRLVQQAVQAGGWLVALPEFSSGGYPLSEQAWETRTKQRFDTRVVLHMGNVQPR